MANSALVQAHNNILTNTQLTSVQTKLNTIKTGLLDVREAIKEVDGTLAEGTIDTIGDDIRTLNRRNYVYLWINNSGTYSLERDINNTNNIAQNQYKTDTTIEAVILPEKITILNQDCFRGTKMKYINLYNITNCQYGALCLNHDLGCDVILPNIVTIGQYGFNGDESVTYFDIGPSIQTIGSKGFSISGGQYATARVIIIRATTPPTIATDSFALNSLASQIIYVPYGCGNTYKSATN